MAGVITIAHGENYIYAVVFDRQAVVVDPGSARPVMRFLDREGRRLAGVLITHFHFDHTGGCTELVRQSRCEIAGPDDPRIRDLTRAVADGEELRFGPVRFRVLLVPGHTRAHAAYWSPELKAVFTGDLLFGAGCGRQLEVPAETMWESLQRIAALPDDTDVYFGHEYTLDNLEFALHIEPDNAAVKRRLEEARRRLQAGKPTAPGRLALEKETNPFLRADSAEMRRAAGLAASVSAAHVFAELRRRKDLW